MSHLGERLSALVDGELGHAQRERVLAHLARCEPCRREAAALRTLKQRMQALSEATAAASLTERLMALDALAGPLPARRWGFPGKRPAAGPARPFPVRSVALATLVMFGLALPATGFLMGGGQSDPGPSVTPAVDVFSVQHAISNGEVPAKPAGDPFAGGQEDAPGGSPPAAGAPTAAASPAASPPGLVQQPAVGASTAPSAPAARPAASPAPSASPTASPAGHRRRHHPLHQARRAFGGMRYPATPVTSPARRRCGHGQVLGHVARCARHPGTVCPAARPVTLAVRRMTSACASGPLPGSALSSRPVSTAALSAPAPCSRAPFTAFALPAGLRPLSQAG